MTNNKKKKINIHFSIDDFITTLEDISRNNYKSIFDNKIFMCLKKLNDTYGIIVTLNCFYYNYDYSFCLNDITQKYYNDFKKNKWIKFSFHGIDINNELDDKSTLEKYYCLMKKNIKKNYSNRLTKISRIHNYKMNQTILNVLPKKQIYLLKNNNIRKNVKYYEDIIRIENSNINDLKKEMKKNNNKYLIMFTHEWCFYDDFEKIYKKINTFLKYLKLEYDIKFIY